MDRIRVRITRKSGAVRPRDVGDSQLARSEENNDIKNKRCNTASRCKRLVNHSPTFGLSLASLVNMLL